MRIIDKTPLVNEDGSISLINRIKGTLQYGFSWYPDLQVQQRAIDFFKKELGKKFTLLRNVSLGNSKIIIPFILVGPPGVWVIYVTHLAGTYRAKSDAWGTVSGGSFKEASINLLKRTARFSKAVQIYLERQGFELPGEVEPVLLSVNPALHISSVRPIVRIVMSDAVSRFAASLAQEPPKMTTEIVHEMANKIADPTPPKTKESSPKPKQVAQSPKKPKKPTQKKSFAESLGMTQKQLIILGVMGFVVVCLLISLTIGALFYFA